MNSRNNQRRNHRILFFVGLISIIITLVISVGMPIVAPKVIDKILVNQPSPLPRSPTNSSTSSDPRISLGEKVLIEKEDTSGKRQDFRELKQKGTDAFQERDYLAAEDAFRLALEKYSNAPETRIYLNNSTIRDQESYTLAVVAPFTHKSSSLAILRGVAQAQQKINQSGGIKGILLRVMIVDDWDDNPASGREIANFLATNSSILGIIGHYSSGSTEAAIDVYEKEEVPVISPSSTSVTLSNLPKKNSFFFRTIPNDAESAKKLAVYAVDVRQAFRVALFYDATSDYSKSLLKAFKQELRHRGGTVTGEFDLSREDFDAVTSVKNAIDTKTQAFMLAAPEKYFDKAFEVVRENQDSSVSLLGGDELLTPKTLEGTKEKGLRMVVPAAWHIQLDPNSDFAKESIDLWKATVNGFSATAYDATQAFAKAMESGSSRSRIQQALADPGFSASAALGTVKFTPSGDRDAEPYLLEIQKAKGKKPYTSNTGYDFFPVK